MDHPLSACNNVILHCSPLIFIDPRGKFILFLRRHTRGLFSWLWVLSTFLFLINFIYFINSHKLNETLLIIWFHKKWMDSLWAFDVLQTHNTSACIPIMEDCPGLWLWQDNRRLHLCQVLNIITMGTICRVTVTLQWLSSRVIVSVWSRGGWRIRGHKRSNKAWFVGLRGNETYREETCNQIQKASFSQIQIVSEPHFGIMCIWSCNLTTKNCLICWKHQK